jgi:hypothetical protein
LKHFLTISLTSFVFSSALWIIWSYFILNFEDSPNWSGSFFYLPHAARVLCIVFFGWRAIPALFFAELWGPSFNILIPSSLINILPSMVSVLSVPLALQTLNLFDFHLGNTKESPLNKRNYKHIALITLVSAIYNSLLVNLAVNNLSLSSSQVGIDQVIRFFIGDILGTAVVLIILAFMLNPIFRIKPS